MLNTRYDYEFVKDNNISGWQAEWLRLIEGRFICNKRITEDANAEIYRLGFTVAEVQAALGITGPTQIEINFQKYCPDWYDFIDGKLTEKEGYKKNIDSEELKEALDKKLSEIDAARESELRVPFLHDGHTFYFDVDYIQGVFSVLPLLPIDWTIEWKTADKPDGLNNTYIILDKAAVSGLASATFMRKSKIWAKYDAKKKAVKLLKTAKEVEGFY